MESAAWGNDWKKIVYDRIKNGKPASTNPYKGKEDREEFYKGFYAWLMHQQKTEYYPNQTQSNALGVVSGLGQSSPEESMYAQGAEGQ